MTDTAVTAHPGGMPAIGPDRRPVRHRCRLPIHRRGRRGCGRRIRARLVDARHLPQRNLFHHERQHERNNKDAGAD